MNSYYSLRGAILLFLGLVIYAQTFRFGFVFDDHIFIVTNPYIKNIDNFHLIWQAFPLTRLVGMFSFYVNYQINQLDPFGYHLFNFIVHLTTTVLVWALAHLLFKITKISSANGLHKELPFVIALLFLIHPGQTQAVTYITQRFESMAAMFYIGAFYVYLRARLSLYRGTQIALLGLAGILTILGILTKEVVITLPAVILAAEWVLFPKKENKKLHVVLLLAGGVLLYLLFTKLVYTDWKVLLRSVPSESHDGDLLTPGSYFLTQMRVFLTFLRLLVFPINQHLDYDYPASSSLWHPPLTLIGAVVIGIVMSLVWKLRRSFPLIAFGMAWVLITFSINLVPRANVIFEHKLYLISFGFFLAVVAGLVVIVKNQGTLLKVFGCGLVILSIVSFQRNKVWANELLLWQDCIRHAPNKARVNASLGRAYGSLGKHEEAIAYFTKAIALSPDNITYENRGVSYSLAGRKQEALADLNKSVAMDPNYSLTYTKRAWVYYEMNDIKAALADLERAIQLDPYFVDSYIERGMIWVNQGEYEKALNDFQQVLRIDPFNASAARYKEYCLQQLGRK